MRRVAERLGFSFEGVLRVVHARRPTGRATTRCTAMHEDRPRRTDDRMDLNKLTMKSQAALQEAHAAGGSPATTSRSSPSTCCSRCSPTPRASSSRCCTTSGANPAQLRARVDEALDAIPKVYAQGGRGALLAGRPRRCSRPPAPRPRRSPTSTSRPSTCCSRCSRRRHEGGRRAARRRAHARRRARGARRGARSPARHEREPRGHVPVAREVRARPHRGRARRASSTR